MTRNSLPVNESPLGVQDPLELENRIETDQARAFLTGNLDQPKQAIVAALVFWMSFGWANPQPGVIVWALLIHTTQLLRYLRARTYYKLPDDQKDESKEVQRLSTTMAASGTVWALAPWLFFPAGNLPLTAVMMLLLLSMSSLSMISMAQYRKGALNFNLPIYFGLVTALLWQGDLPHTLLALGAAIYGYSSIHFGLHQIRVFADVLRTRYEKENLAVTLAEQVQIVERASLEKTRFFASASHDLRQPLHSLGLFGSAIHARLKDTPDEPLAKNLMHCVDALETSFSAMLDLSKLDAGVVEVNIQPTSLAVVFRRLANTFTRQAEARGLALRFKPGNKWVHVDAALLERLLGNLIHNALKFTTKGGVLVLARGIGKKIHLEVWDTGCGISANELALVFDEFYQIGNQERDRAKGLGMGLAIVKRLSNLMRAAVQVRSRVGRGSVFKLSLDAAPVSTSQPETNLQTINSGIFRALTGMRILVVDDELAVRESTAAALRLYGLQVELADSLQQAQVIAAQWGDRLDALITDYRLRNGLDGLEVVSQLQLLLKRKIPTLLITGDTAPERVRMAQKSGLKVMYKPVKINDMVEALRLQISAGPMR